MCFSPYLGVGAGAGFVAHSYTKKYKKSTKKCKSEENMELRIGTKMYENVRIVGMMDMTILPI